MVIWTNFVLTVTQMLQMILQLYLWVVIIAVVLSWIEPNPYNPIVRAIYGLTDPVFDWVRRHIPVIFGGIDFSPMVVFLAIYFAQSFLIPTVRHIAIYGFN